MQDAIRHQIAELEAEYPGYQVWHVPILIGPDTWAARRHDGRGELINTSSADELQQAIIDEIDELDGDTDDGQYLPAPTVEEMREIFFPHVPDGRYLR